MNLIKAKIITAFVIASLNPLLATAHSQSEVQVKKSLGTAVKTQAVIRSITILPAKKYVNVNQGDVVTFISDGKQFTWLFDTLRPTDDFNLSSIAPAEMITHGVRIYVGPNPLYAN